MRSYPNMVMIGAAGRNVGKTEYACELIRRYVSSHLICGVKITPVEKRDGACPRGGMGCGECGALKENYCITEECLADTDKDTVRMLRAGAQRVFWLRVMQEHLEEGVNVLLSCIPANALVVCESNSARTIVKPGLFLVIQDAAQGAIKESCAAVMGLADRRVVFHGKGWDFSPDRIAVSGGRWVIRPDATAIILAGGASRRMGQDKSLMAINGQPMIGHIASQLDFFPERLISSSESGKYAFLGIPIIPDRELGWGPLMGILSCMAQATHDLCFVTGCDIPMLDPGFIMYLLAQVDDYDIVIPRHPDGQLEPLLAVYRKTVIPVAEAALKAGNRRVDSILGQLRVRFIEVDQLDWYANLNTMEDYRLWTKQDPH